MTTTNRDDLLLLIEQENGVHKMFVPLEEKLMSAWEDFVGQYKLISISAGPHGLHNLLSPFLMNGISSENALEFLNHSQSIALQTGHDHFPPFLDKIPDIITVAHLDTPLPSEHVAKMYAGKLAPWTTLFIDHNYEYEIEHYGFLLQVSQATSAFRVLKRELEKKRIQLPQLKSEYPADTARQWLLDQTSDYQKFQQFITTVSQFELKGWMQSLGNWLINQYFRVNELNQARIERDWESYGSLYTIQGDPITPELLQVIKPATLISTENITPRQVALMIAQQFRTKHPDIAQMLITHL